MITATETITLFNRRYDKESRRDVFIPTVIKGVAYHEARGRTSTGGITSGGSVYAERCTYQMRIPIDAEVQAGRQFVDDITYAALDDEAAAGYWTLADNCYCVLGGSMPDEGAEVERLTEDEIKKSYGGRLISVVEFADDTRRGSRSVRHWRIGGE